MDGNYHTLGSNNIHRRAPQPLPLLRPAHAHTVQPQFSVVPGPAGEVPIGSNNICLYTFVQRKCPPFVFGTQQSPAEAI